MKLCYNCKHIQVNEHVLGWSDMTPSTPFGMYCTKGYWNFDTDEATSKSIKECLETANTCPDYANVEYTNLNDSPKPYPSCLKCGTNLVKIYDRTTVLTMCPIC